MWCLQISVLRVNFYQKGIEINDNNNTSKAWSSSIKGPRTILSLQFSTVTVNFVQVLKLTNLVDVYYLLCALKYLHRSTWKPSCAMQSVNNKIHAQSIKEFVEGTKFYVQSMP